MKKSDQRVGHVPKIAQNLFLRPQWRRISIPAAKMSMPCPFPRKWALMYSNVFEPKICSIIFEIRPFTKIMKIKTCENFSLYGNDY
jgi:hypothetical protein